MNEAWEDAGDLVVTAQSGKSVPSRSVEACWDLSKPHQKAGTCMWMKFERKQVAWWLQFKVVKTVRFHSINSLCSSPLWLSPVTSSSLSVKNICQSNVFEAIWPNDIDFKTFTYWFPRWNAFICIRFPHIRSNLAKVLFSKYTLNGFPVISPILVLYYMKTNSDNSLSNNSDLLYTQLAKSIFTLSNSIQKSMQIHCSYYYRRTLKSSG